MNMDDDGDIIRGLGYVVLHAAYLEETIDECIEVILANDPTEKKSITKAPSSKKIELIQKQLKSLNPLTKELERLPELLDAISALLEDRNEVIHGRIYAVPGSGDVRVSTRKGGSQKPATSAELYALVDDLKAAHTSLLHPAMFALARLYVAAKQNP